MKLKELKKIGFKKLIECNVGDELTKINILIQFILKMDKMQIMLNDDVEVEENKQEKFFEKIEEIRNGKPIQYITNNQEFMGLNFYVDENVLIPQPDTELLVEEAICAIKTQLKLEDAKINQNNSLNTDWKQQIADKKENKTSIKILDLCTGSGAIAVAIENYFLSNNNIENDILKIYASDISEKALEIAKKNAISNNKNTEINFILSDMFDKIIENDFDIIISNPPYIETETILGLSKEVQSEPHIALDGGMDGLKFYKIIATKAKEYLKENGQILLEIGYNQKEEVINLLNNENYLDISSKKDLSGNDRVVKCRYETV